MEKYDNGLDHGYATSPACSKPVHVVFATTNSEKQVLRYVPPALRKADRIGGRLHCPLLNELKLKDRTAKDSTKAA